MKHMNMKTHCFECLQCFFASEKYINGTISKTKMVAMTAFNIPNQLASCQFIKTLEKVPIEEKWQLTNNYSFDKFKPGSTYGVATGFSKLVVVDCDKQYIQDKLLEIEEFRNTFTVRTATKKLYHFYFKVDIENPKSFFIDNNHSERVIDVQAKGKMVIGPNSTLKSGESYTIVNDCEILEIPYQFLKTILTNIDSELLIGEKADKKPDQVYFDFDDIAVQIKEKISVKQVLEHLKVPTLTNPTMCPLGHSSEGGKCFSYSQHVWYCFHCHQSGNIFHLYQKSNKITFAEAKYQLAILAGLSEDNRVKILGFYSRPKDRHIASEMMAKEFITFHNVYTVREDKKEVEVYIYKDGIYVPEGKTFIREYVRSVLGNLYNEAFTNQVISKIIVDTFIEAERFFIDEPPNLLPVQNGILDLDTDTLRDYTPKLKFFTKLPVIYDPMIEAEKTVQFIKDIIKDESDLLTIQEIAGYLLYRENKFEKAFMFLGTGRNGKSKKIELLEKLIGKYNTTNISLKTLETDQFALCNFQNKYANFSPDLSKAVLQETGNFKSLVGRDMITANRKFKSRVSYKNYAKLIFAANDLPITMDYSDGFWDRWIIIDFPYKFVPNPELPFEKKQDTNIIEKITTSKEMTGFLNWSIEGLKRLLSQKHFSKNLSTEETKRKWLTMSSSFNKFWLEEVEVTGDFTDTVSLNDLYQCYENYCDFNNIDKESTKARRFLMERKFHCSVKRLTINKESVFVVKKIKLKNPFESSEDPIEILER